MRGEYLREVEENGDSVVRESIQLSADEVLTREFTKPRLQDTRRCLSEDFCSLIWPSSCVKIQLDTEYVPGLGLGLTYTSRLSLQPMD